MAEKEEKTDWIGTREAAEIMGIRQNSVNDKCRKRLITCQKLGRDWMVWREDAEAHEKSKSGRPRRL